MAESEPKVKNNEPAGADENDPVLQGVDRIQPKTEIDSRLASEDPQNTEDTHTKTNIHLGGRDDEGIGTPPEELDGVPSPQSLESIIPQAGGPGVSGGLPAEPSGSSFEPAGVVLPEDPEFQSSGRATPQVEIEGQEDGRPTTDPLAGTRDAQTGDVTIMLEGVDNNPPVAGLVDLGATDEDTSRNFSVDDLLANATDDDGDILIVSNVTIHPDHGVIIDNGDGTYTFEPAPDFFGDDLPISFVISDGTDDIPGRAIIDVLPVNDPPTSADDEAVTNEDTSYGFSLDDFAFSDIEDDDFDHLTIVDLPDEGTLYFDGDPVSPGDNIPSGDLELLIFTPDENENGEDYASFNFTVNDGTDDSEEYTFSIDVTPVNDPPTSADDGAVIDEDTSHSFSLDDFAFSDIEGDSFDHITIVSLPAEGELTFDGSPVGEGDTISPADFGLLVYTPDEDENGDDYASFNFTVNDGTDDSGEYTFSIDVTPVNDPPTSADNEKTIPEDGSYGFAAADFVFDDIDGDSMDHITITELPANGELTLFGNPVSQGDDIDVGDIVNLLFSPDADASGENYGDFKFTVNDGNLDSGEYDFSIDVTARADTPNLCLLGQLPESSGLYDISGGGTVTIDATYYAAIADLAQFENTHGYYVADSDGNPIGGAIIQDNFKEGGNFDISFNTDEYPGGVTLGFFIIPDGDTQNISLEDGDPVTFELIDGIWTPLAGGVPLNGAPSLPPFFEEGDALPAFFSNPDLNADNYDHLIDNMTLGNQNWEDLVNGGDGDYTDLNAAIVVTLETCDDLEAQGLEGTLIALPDVMTSLNDTDGSESLMVTISGIPEGVILSDDQGNEFTATEFDNSVDVTGWDLYELKVFSPLGQDDFVLQVTSKATEASNADEASAMRNINVDILHAPETSPVDLGATPEDTNINFSAADLLVNATDEDGDMLFTLNVTINPAYGTIIDNGNGTYTFDPADDFYGDDLPISYDITDGIATIAGSAIIDVTPVNDPPVASDDENSGDEDTQQTGNVLDNDDDVDGTITVSTVGIFETAHGSINIAEDGEYTYTPDANYHGPDSFEYTIVDDDGAEAMATLHLSVDAVADDPDLCILNPLEGASGFYDISQGGEITIDAEYFPVDARFSNSHGYYLADGDGNPIHGVVIENNVKDEITAPVTFDTADYPGAVTLGFFIIPNGATYNETLSDGAVVTFEQIDGAWVPHVAGVPLESEEQNATFYSDPALNADGYNHFEDNEEPGNQNWEDLWNGGDHDFGDVNAQITIRTCEDEAEVEGQVERYLAIPEITSMLNDLDGSEALTIMLTGIAVGVEIIDGDGNSFTASGGDTEVDISSWDLASLKLMAPDGTADFVMSVDATATEGSNSDTATTSGTITVDLSAASITTAGGDVVILSGGIPVMPAGYNEINGDDGPNVIVGTSLDDFIDGAGGADTITGNNGDDILIGGDDGDTLIGGNHNDLIVGGAGNDIMQGGQHNDTFMFSAGEGNDSVDGGASGSWTDVIELRGFGGLNHEVGWTLVLDSGTVQSTDDEAGEMLLSQDADGTITFDEGGSITFENIEKISW